MSIHCSILERYDIKALLNFSPHQALEIFGLQKAQDSYDKLSKSRDWVNLKVKGDCYVLLQHEQMEEVKGHIPCLLMIFTEVVLYSESCTWSFHRTSKDC